MELNSLMRNIALEDQPSTWVDTQSLKDGRIPGLKLVIGRYSHV